MLVQFTQTEKNKLNENHDIFDLGPNGVYCQFPGTSQQTSNHKSIVEHFINCAIPFKIKEWFFIITHIHNMVAHTIKTVQKFQWEILLCSPSLMPSDYHLFLHLKNWLLSQHFLESEEISVSDIVPTGGIVYFCIHYIFTEPTMDWPG